jgi:hypothetical protein
MENMKIKTPAWYWITAFFFLLWNVMGVLSFFMHTFISAEDLAALSDPEQALYGSYPMWTTLVFAIAVFAGTLGSVGLVLKKKWSKTAFIISLCAIIPQMIHNVFFTKSMDVYGPGEAATMPIMVVVFGVFLVWYSTRLITKDWLK